MSEKNFLVAGGNSGIGREVVSLLLEADANITVLSRNREGVPEGAKVRHHVWDVRNPFPDAGELPELPEKLDGAVYLPGTIKLKPFPLLKDDDYLTDYTVNVLGAVRMIRGIIRNLKAARGAAVFFGSAAGTTGFPFHASIGPAKAALAGLTRSLAAEFAASGVRFNLIALSLTDTPLAAGLLRTEKQRSAAEERHPLKGIGDASEAASWALKLLEPESRWITGQVITLDGGIGTLRSG